MGLQGTQALERPRDSTADFHATSIRAVGGIHTAYQEAASCSRSFGQHRPQGKDLEVLMA